MVQPGELAVRRLDVGGCCGRRHAEPLVVRFHAVFSPSAPRLRTLEFGPAGAVRPTPRSGTREDGW